MRAVVLLLVLSLALQAGATRADNFADALSKAESLKAPAIVLVHGSSWHPASQHLYENIWQEMDFAGQLSTPLVVSSIHIRQNADKAWAEQEKAGRKGWQQGPIKTYPAIQVYGHDGTLLKTIQGRALGQPENGTQLAAKLNPVVEAAKQRADLLPKFESAAASGNHRAALDMLSTRIRLPLDREPDIIKMLQRVDPEDQSGWQARLNFSGWPYMRELTGRLAKGEAGQILAETEASIASNVHPPEQLLFILAARGRALTQLERYEEAWQSFHRAAAQVPGSPDSVAVFNYGLRTAGAATREILDPRSPLARAQVGKNLTKERATFTLSSQAHDDGSNHPTLMTGPLSSGSAFHTANEAGAHIIIDLDGPCELRAIRIVNRINIHERAEGLTVWASSDQQSWKPIWQAENVQAEWEIILQAPVRASYLKVGLPKDTANFLHLRAVDAFGKRL